MFYIFSSIFSYLFWDCDYEYAFIHINHMHLLVILENMCHFILPLTTDHQIYVMYAHIYLQKEPSFEIDISHICFFAMFVCIAYKDVCFVPYIFQYNPSEGPPTTSGSIIWILNVSLLF